MKRQTFIGIDPGEVWFGYAILDVVDRHCQVGMGVFSVTHRGLDELVGQVKLWLPANVVVESYQARPVGHQRFGGGLTSMIIGALKHGVQESRTKSTFNLVQPGEPDHELPLLGLSRYIEEWRHMCPTPMNKSWHHSRAAWRVLGRHLLSHHAELLQPLKSNTVFKSFMCPVAQKFRIKSRTRDDLIAPEASWRLPS